MNPEEIIAREEARLGRRLNPAEKAAIRGGATSLDDRTVRASAAALEAERTRAEGRRSLAEAAERDDTIAGALGGHFDRVARERRAEGGLNTIPADWLESGDAVTAGVSSGASMGFDDEMIGAASNPLGAALATGRLLGVEALEGDPDLAEYDAARDEARGRYDRLAEESPYAVGFGELAGGLLTAPATPGLRVGNVATRAARAAETAGTLTPALRNAARLERASRIGAGAATGATYGGIAGAGSSDADSIPGVLLAAGVGAVGGGLVGTGLSGAGEGLATLADMAPSARRTADTRLLAVPGGGSRASVDRLVRDVGGGDVSRAASRIRSEGLIGPLSTPADVAAVSGGLRSPGPAEAAMAAHPEGGIDPRRLADIIDAEVSRFPNPEERARRAALTRYAEGLRGMGSEPEFLASERLPTPDPGDMAPGLDAPRMSTVGDDVPDYLPETTPDRPATVPPGGPARRRVAMADTGFAEIPEPGFRDTARNPVWHVEGTPDDMPPVPIEPFMPTDVPNSIPHWAPPEPPPAPRSRPRGERPLGARPMTGEWRGGDPRPRTIPFSGSGPTDRSPGSAMHVLDVLDEMSGWSATDPAEVACSARGARRGVRGELDRHMEETLGPEAFAEHLRTRRDASVANPVNREAEAAARAFDARSPGAMDMGLGGLAGIISAATGHGAHSIPAALGTAGLAYGARRALAGRGPAVMAAGAETAARALESGAARAVGDAAPGLAASATPVIARDVGAATEDSPEPLPTPRRTGRRRGDPMDSSVVEVSTEPLPAPRRTGRRRTRSTP